MKKDKVNRKRITVLVIVTLILLGAIFWILKFELDTKIKSNTETHLIEQTEAVSAVFYTKLDDQLIMLESQTRYFKDIDLTDYNALKNTIMSTKGIGAFKTIGVADSSGATMNYNGKSSGNIYLRDYYKTAMNGENAISSSTITDEDGEEVLVLAVPIVKNNGVAGIIYGTFTKSTLDSIMNTVNFSNENESMIVNSEEKIIAKTNNSVRLKTATVLEDVISSAKFPPSESADVNYYSTPTSDKIAVTIPIGLHDWYFVNIFPSTVVVKQTTDITMYFIFAVSGVIAIFSGILLYILMLIRNNEQIETINERFRLVASQSHNIIFSYDYKAGRLNVEGNPQVLIPEIKPYYDRNEVLRLLQMIHHEDSSIAKELLRIKNDEKSSLFGEFRIKCTDSNYYWYRLNATVIRDSNKNPVQIIGSLYNVDEQMTKEIKLIEKAQTDSLTGILNKGAFQTKVGQYITNIPEDEAGALFIIDLDNFKAVNDNLGHAVGDQVIVDVANKLSEIFKMKNSVGRIGGDEFSAFLPLETNEHEKIIKAISQKGEIICKSLKETYSAFKIDVTVSASVGVSVYPENGKNYDTLYRNADSALYKIKTTTKNNFKIYTEEDKKDD